MFPFIMCTSPSLNQRSIEEPEDELPFKICKTLQDDIIDFLKEARKNPIKTDVFFLACDDKHAGASLSAHKEVLAAASPYLAEILETSYDCDVYISFSDFKQSQLKLLLDYIYTGEIYASKTLMEEFEFCLKEMGILGTHSLACSNEIITTPPTNMAPLSNTVQLPCSLQTSSSSKNLPTNSRTHESVILQLESSENKTSASNPSNYGDDISEEENGPFSYTIMDDGRPYVCPICQKSFRHLNVLRTHSRVHTGEKPFSCNTCNRAFSHKSTLNEHMNLHSGDRPYSCEKCHRRFKQRKSLRAHRCEVLEEDPFQCEVCKRNFVNRKALALHRIHHDSENKKKLPQEKPFLCDICARGFSNKYLLKAHQMTHVEEKNFECNVCHKKFALKKTLQVHEASHEPENKNPYQCSFCGKKFRFLASLNAHELIHTGQKPFGCNKCGVAFRQKWSLKEHMLVHDKPEEIPFTCEICNKSFQARRKFVAHRYSHNQQTKRCPVCKKRFYNAERLASHIAEHENVKDLPVPEAIGNAVTAHMNDAGELIIIQDVDDIDEGTLIFTPSLLHVIKTTDETCQEIEGSEGQDEGNRWSLEVVIEPDVSSHQTC